MASRAASAAGWCARYPAADAARLAQAIAAGAGASTIAPWTSRSHTPAPGGSAMPRTGLVVAVLLLSCAGPAAAQDAKRTHTITVADYFTQADLFGIAIAPGGDGVVYTEGRWQQSTDDRKT